MNDSTLSPEVAEFDISGIEAMFAGTLCLMSAYAHGGCDSAQHRSLVGLKIVSNLSCLQCQSRLSPEFRRVLSKVCESWRHQALGSVAASSSWLSAPATMQ